VTAQNRPLDSRAHYRFERIELRAQMKMQIQPAMVDAFQSDDDIALLDGFLDAGEAGHTSNRLAPKGRAHLRKLMD
jgi:hypothetical protein